MGFKKTAASRLRMNTEKNFDWGYNYLDPMRRSSFVVGEH